MSETALREALEHATFLEGIFVSEDVPATKARQIAKTLRALAALASAPSQPSQDGKYPQPGTAKQRYEENGINDEEEPDPVERLRFFCSLAMHGDDWLDVEPFFDAVIADRAARQSVIDGALEQAAFWKAWAEDYVSRHRDAAIQGEQR